MQIGALTNQFDVGLLAFLVFVLFFAGLIYYLHREDKREGYPLIGDRSKRGDRHEGFPPMPAPKKFIVKHGEPIYAPRVEGPSYPLAAAPSESFPGAPLNPTGNPMVDGVGPAAYAMRSDKPDLDWSDGKPRIVPLRLLPDWFLALPDPDPRGLPVVGSDDLEAGTVRDVWIDRSEVVIRYLEIDVAGGKRVLAPMPMVKIEGKRGRVKIRSLTQPHFADIPATKILDEVTLREEDRISAYYAGGQFYARAKHAEPLL